MKKILGITSLASAGAAAVLAISLNAAPASAETVTLYKNPQCGCCENYADYLRENGYTVEVKPTHELTQISEEAGISEKIQGCHTAFLGDYVVSGHVPVEVVNKMLTEKPEITGITLPGMPMGSPGMGGAKQKPFEILAVKAGAEPTVYAVE
ncbi:MAG: DUF411 domain-containing protein [Sulfitobacter sp.]|jgi:hypothetical protein|uniref:DUF411 domain-containing protein n=1 Tax=Sulfitobacter sp. TaxID=1903071 RepID=UPI000C0EACAA|nr:metal-binding protein [Roseobacter sp.]MBV50257.1 metal-binding protein [Roseobacter sp.]PHR10030.1 MAG: metal-binding protein [Sulfitobacter sp.]|tara:strand:- start:3638 stop:4093 length:456 start_codon:yes stop_codon:yes gene_type:complete